MAVVTKKCYYSNISKFILFYFCSSLIATLKPGDQVWVEWRGYGDSFLYSNPYRLISFSGFQITNNATNENWWKARIDRLKESSETDKNNNEEKIIE